MITFKKSYDPYDSLDIGITRKSESLMWGTWGRHGQYKEIKKVTLESRLLGHLKAILKHLEVRSTEYKPKGYSERINELINYKAHLIHLRLKNKVSLQYIINKQQFIKTN